MPLFTGSRTIRPCSAGTSAPRRGLLPLAVRLGGSEAAAALLARLRFFLAQAVSALFRSLGVTSLAVVTIGVALAVFATFAVIVEHLERLADQLGREVEVSAYLGRAVGERERERLALEVRAFDGVSAVRYVSSEAAMAELREGLGEDAVLLDGLPPDVVPHSLEIRLDPRSWTPGEARGVADRIAKLQGIEDVRFGQEDIERVDALLGFARIAALVLGTALCLATIVIIYNTIRLTVYARRDEIEIMTLVGATNTFVRAPFVLEGAIQGLLGGALSLGVLLALQGALEAGITRGLGYAYGPMQLHLAPTELAGQLLTAGVALGLIGSLFAVGKFLKV